MQHQTKSEFIARALTASLLTSRGRVAAILVVVGLAAVAVALTPAARASVLVYEGFDMGATAGSLTGKAGATSVGFATGSTWTDNSLPISSPPWEAATYQPTGLTFSSLPVVGGCVAQTTSVDFFREGRTDSARPFGIGVTGTIYGSYLVQLHAPQPDAPPGSPDVSAFIVGSSANYGAFNQQENDSSMQLEVRADTFVTEQPTDLGGYGSGRIHGSLAANNNFDSNTGANALLSDGTTYLVVFKMTGLGASSQTQTLTEWVLSAAQYDNFKAGGLTESALDAASLGTAGTDIMEFGTTSTTDNAQLLDTYYAHLFGGWNANVTFDELRISNASINEAVEGAVIPEPATLVLLGLGGLLLLRRRW